MGKFIEVKDIDGDVAHVNTDYIATITDTYVVVHGNPDMRIRIKDSEHILKQIYK